MVILFLFVEPVFSIIILRGKDRESGQNDRKVHVMRIARIGMHGQDPILCHTLKFNWRNLTILHFDSVEICFIITLNFFY